MTATKAANLCKEQFEDASASTFLVLLVISDGTFILLDLFSQIVMPANSSMFSVGTDLGYPEFYQYIKETWIIVLLILTSYKTKTLGFSVWAILFVYLLLDDALQLHETFGFDIAEYLEFPYLVGLRPRDFGELAVSGICAASFLILLSWYYVRGSEAFRSATRNLLLLLVALAFFGIFVDMLHVSLGENVYVYILLGLVEDGGEMVVMSFITWYAFLLNSGRGRPAHSPTARTTAR